MNTKDVLKNIRIKNNLTQDELAEKLSVTRQAVSRWENAKHRNVKTDFHRF